MEEAKAAAYYDELARKGGAAARFKQGLGFSSSSAAAADDPPARGSALVSSSSSFLGGFVRASSPSKACELKKQSRLESVQNKLRKKSNERKPSEEERREGRVSRRRSRSRSRSREREEERERERRSRRRSRSWSRERYRDGDRDRDRDRHRRRRRSPSRSDSDGDRRRRERRRDRSSSPRDRRAEKRNRSPSPPRERKPKLPEKRNGGGDYSRLIEGYDKMSQAERVKAKMKLQLAETVRKDETKGSSGWERFEFNKDAPLDDEEVQAAEDDTSLVKQIGQSFRSSAVQEKREQKIRDAHDEAMFGTPVFPPPVNTVNKEAEFEILAESKSEDETHKSGIDVVANLLSEKVLAKQQSSWRDRARKQGK